MDVREARRPGVRLYRAAPALHRWSVRRGLLVLILLALLPVTLVSFWQGMMRVEQRRADTAAQMTATAMIVARVADSVLTEKIRLLHAIALHPAVTAATPACTETLQYGRRLIGASARLVRFSADARPQCDTLATGAQAGTDPVRALAPEARAATDWWQRLRAGQNVIAIVPAGSAAAGSAAAAGGLPPILRLAVPILGPDRRFAGALVVREAATWLTARLGAPPDAAGGIAIVDAAGNTLVSSRELPSLVPMQSRDPAGGVRDARGARWLYRLAPLRALAPGQAPLFVVYATPQPPAVVWQNAADFMLPIIAIIAASLAIWIGTERIVLRWLRGLQRLAMQFAGGDHRQRSARFFTAPREIRSVAAALYRSAIAVGERDRRLRDALTRQQLLTRELHHRVRNNLQMVLSLLSLQSSRLEDAAARSAIERARLRVGALALVHRQLYDGDELSGISAQKLLGALCDQLQAQTGDPQGPQLECDFDDAIIDVDTAMPLALWLVEAVGNALSHGFPAGLAGTIAADLRIDGNNAVLRVIDDGVGFDPAAASAGHGLRLIAAIAAQLGGATSVGRGADGGSEARLAFELRRRAEPIGLAEARAAPADPSQPPG